MTERELIHEAVAILAKDQDLPKPSICFSHDGFGDPTAGEVVLGTLARAEALLEAVFLRPELSFAVLFSKMKQSACDDQSGFSPLYQCYEQTRRVRRIILCSNGLITRHYLPAE